MGWYHVDGIACIMSVFVPTGKHITSEDWCPRKDSSGPQVHTHGRSEQGPPLTDCLGQCLFGASCRVGPVGLAFQPGAMEAPRLDPDQSCLAGRPCGLDAACTVQVAGQRYNKNTGELKISCDRHRAREDNRRQALHWLIRLVESGHLKHPSPAWESMKQRQTAFMEAVL